MQKREHSNFLYRSNYDIGYKCKEEILKESDLEEENFNIFDMSSCKNDESKSKDPLKIIDHYTISKIS